MARKQPDAGAHQTVLSTPTGKSSFYCVRNWQSWDLETSTDDAPAGLSAMNSSLEHSGHLLTTQGHTEAAKQSVLGRGWSQMQLILKADWATLQLKLRFRMGQHWFKRKQEDSDT